MRSFDIYLFEHLPAVVMVYSVDEWDPVPGIVFPELITTIRTIKKNMIILYMSPNPDLRQYVQAQGVDYFISKVDSPNKFIKAFRDCEIRMASLPVSHEY